MLASAAFALLIVCLAAAAASDAVRYQIPNGLCLGVAGAFVLYAPALPLAAVAAHVATGLGVLALVAAGFALGLMGGGDAKLLAAVALWLGWRTLLPFLLVMALAGGVLGLALLAARRMAPEPVPPGRWWSRLLSRQSGVPYGVAIAAAAFFMLARFPAEILR